MKKKKTQCRGLVLCYTGNGKGKTTAAIGIIVRAVAHKQKVLLVQFIKNSPSGELTILKKFTPQVMVKQFGCGFCLTRKNTFAPAKHKTTAEKGLSFLREVFSAKRPAYDMVVLDEINLALKLRLLKVKDVVDVLKQRPKHVHLVLTGRYASKKIKDMCDLVSEVKEIKHPFTSGIPAQPGIEY